ncbi:MAG: DNRLRE domain-containing protein, partial [Anaerolineales bacterium]|nr:DNRLRE domain-containing protein [Anaerolineales bacterium]
MKNYRSLTIFFILALILSGVSNVSANSTRSVDSAQKVLNNDILADVESTQTVNLAATADTWLRSSYSTRNYGGSTTLQVSPRTTYPQGSLYLWDVSGIDSDAIVTAASLTFYVTDSSAYAFSLYNMRRAWVEGTNNDATGTGASWDYYDAGTNEWGSGGAANTSSDRYNTNLWDAAASVFGSTGSVTIPLNASGVAVVQDWIDGSLNNYGLTMQNYSGGSDGDYWIVASSENSTYDPPTLNITYNIAATEPTITVSGTLSEFTTTPGVASDAQTYTVQGELLSQDISIIAPTGFELSTDGTTYASSLTLTQTGGEVEVTTIYVRLYSATTGVFSGDITHTSSPAPQVDLAVSGTVAITATATFQYGDSGYSGTDDTFIRGSTAGDSNFGSEDGLEWDDNSGTTTDEITLIHFDEIFTSEGGPIPNGAIINSATLTYMTTDLSSGSTAEGDLAEVYESLVAWDGSTATYNNFGGDAGVQTDEYYATLIDEALADEASTQYSIDVTASLQRWSDGTANYGWIFLPTDDDGVTIYSSDHTTVAYHPLLSVTYTVPSGPYISTSGTLSPFSTEPGVPSDAQTYTVAGTNLTDDILITAPDGFQLSTDGSAYMTGLTLTQSGGSVLPTTVYVRLYSEDGDTYSGNIIHTSTGAASVNVAVSGVVMSGWIAYNDCGYIDGQTTTNITTYECYTDDESGVLVDYNTGENTPATVTVATSGTINSQLTSDYYGAEPNSGTDAYTTFHDYVNMVGGIRLGSTSSSIELTFSGLDSAQTYAFAATANRDNDEYMDRITQFTIGGVDAAANASTSGVTVDSEYSVHFITGYNAVNGYAARWTGIQPGMDGEFTVTFEVNTSQGGDYAYGPAVFVLQEEETAAPRIKFSGTLSEFTSSPGVYSAEQSYLVSGSNLTHDITITAPADFEISTTSGSGFGSTLTLTQSGGVVASTPIYVRFYRADAGTSTGNISHESIDATTKNMAVVGTASYENHAPNQPVLVQPADDATGISTSPTLEVTVSDPDLDDLNVTFYGREVGSGGGEDFTFFVIPDTQSHVSSASGALIFNEMTDYIVAKKTDFNVAFATHVGDIVNTANSTAEWERADAAMDILDAGSVPNSVLPGNHDLPLYSSPSYYNTYFGPDRFTGNGYYQGPYASGENENNYSFFSASGMDFILINLQYNADSGMLDWADGLLKANPNRRGIVAQHNILNTNNSWQNEATYTALKDNPNLFLIVCGHMHSSSDGSAYRAETGDFGQTIHVLLTDYQDYNGSGNTGYMRILTFKPADDEIYAQIYSPYVDAYLTSESNYEQFTMAYDMDGSAPFEVIGTVTGVSNGSNASITWSGLVDENEYEWYAEASDGALSTNSSTWSFTTGAAANHAPVITETDPQAVTMSEDSSPTAFNLTLHATDEDAGDTLTWTISSPASHGVASASGTGTSKAIGYTPTLNYNGLDSFVVQVSDGKGGMDTITVNVTIQAVNDAPVLAAIGNKSVNELVQLSFIASASDVDLPAQTLTYSLANGASGAVPGGAGINSTSGAFTWTPTEAQGPGPYTFDVCVSDGLLSDCETITVTVNE